jgi:hypothetical protein
MNVAALTQGQCPGTSTRTSKTRVVSEWTQRRFGAVLRGRNVRFSKMYRFGPCCRAASASQPGDSQGQPALGDVPPPTNNGPDEEGGDGDGDGNGSGAALLLAAGRAVETLPADIAQAFQKGTLPRDMLSRYLDMSSSGNPLLRWMMQFQGFRERLLADPGFLVKVAIEVGIGICTKTTAEYAKRGDQFESQLDFVFANICMALVADFMLVWLPAPTYAANQSAMNGAKNSSFSMFSNIFKGCPDNAFQKVPPGYQPFTLAQRCGAVVRNGSKLFVVGFFASLLGVGLTNGLITIREMLDPAFVPLNDPQDVATMSAAYGLYMASSSNLRYQVLAGIIEERGIEVMFKSNPAVCGVLSFAVRTGNTFLGSLLWVDFLNLLGLQKIGH